jgi:hypothetical protein
MSEKIDQFCENLRVQMTNVECYLKKVGDSIKAAPAEAQSEIRARIEAAKSQHEQNMRKLSEAKTQLEARVEDKKTELSDQIEQWKRDRELGKLDKRAEKAEGYAIAAIEFAAAATAEAELATLRFRRSEPIFAANPLKTRLSARIAST